MADMVLICDHGGNMARLLQVPLQSTKKPVTSLQQPDHYRRCVKGLGIPPYRSTSTKALSTSSTFQRSFSFPASRSTRDRSALKYVPSVLPLARGTRVS